MKIRKSIGDVMTAEHFKFATDHMDDWLGNYSIEEGYNIFKSYLDKLDENEQFHICNHFIFRRNYIILFEGIEYIDFDNDKLNKIRDMVIEYKNNKL